MAANWISAPKRTHRAGGLLAVIAGLVFIGVGLVPGDTSAEGNEDTKNQVEDWCDYGGTKFDNLNTKTFTVPPPPEGKEWDNAVVKAGSEHSVDNPYTEYESVEVGQELTHASGKDISWVIICWKPPTTTTTSTTTTTTTSTTVPGSSTTTTTTTPESTSTTTPGSSSTSSTTSTTTPASSSTSSTSTSVASQAGTTSTTAVAAAGGTTTTVVGAAGALPTTGGDAGRNTALIALGAILVLVGGALVWLGRPAA